MIGVFKDKKTGEIVKGDDFMAEVAGNAEHTYKLYLQWNIDVFDENREFISAEWGDKK